MLEHVRGHFGFREPFAYADRCNIPEQNRAQLLHRLKLRVTAPDTQPEWETSSPCRKPGGARSSTDSLTSWPRRRLRSASKSERPSGRQNTAWLSIRNDWVRTRLAVSTMAGKRSA